MTHSTHSAVRIERTRQTFRNAGFAPLRSAVGFRTTTDQYWKSIMTGRIVPPRIHGNLPRARAAQPFRERRVLHGTCVRHALRKNDEPPDERTASSCIHQFTATSNAPTRMHARAHGGGTRRLKRVRSIVEKGVSPQARERDAMVGRRKKTKGGWNRRSRFLIGDATTCSHRTGGIIIMR
ncbi:hypothetical protein DMN91_006825 [Ooceraea biroi]|uniref:Uncharacterized protein n=1 Tax=Ooceraea biroi TaxID=2015173 RepID=A0A3L8DK53_OOCBI|nr:hypothetical protein DMN91_006825 [Ooceraea biroi]